MRSINLEFVGNKPDVHGRSLGPHHGCGLVGSASGGENACVNEDECGRVPRESAHECGHDCGGESEPACGAGQGCEYGCAPGCGDVSVRGMLLLGQIHGDYSVGVPPIPKNKYGIKTNSYS